MVAVAMCISACIAASCSARDRGGARGAVLVDDFGDTIVVAAVPQRVVSLNPATTELVFALGASARLVGRSRWDTYPDSATLVPSVGDGMRPNIEAVLGVRPDLVLLYASEENRAARDAFRRAGIATLTQRVDRSDEFARAVVALGIVLGDSARGAAVRDSVLASLDRARSLTRDLPRVRVVWPLWDAPLMAVGRGSFLNELIDAAGGENIFVDLDAPSPQVTFEEVIRRDPDAILAAPTSAARMRADPRWRALRAVRNGRIIAYDTTLVGRPGVRLGEAALHLARVLHPERSISR
ncbi:MAG TPA: helical backbone metal receptor [Gemmatimonadaceae bacterium]|nr:helical backbone metal receptor [Gemmatimonadaceae bacterium]